MKSVKFNKKKMGIAVAALAVAIGAALFLYRSEPARAAPQMVSAKEAMAEARAKLGKGPAPNAPASTATVAKARPAPFAAPTETPTPAAPADHAATGVNTIAIAETAVAPASAQSAAPNAVAASAATAAVAVPAPVAVPSSPVALAAPASAGTAVPTPSGVLPVPAVRANEGRSMDGSYFATIAALEEQTDIAERQARLNKLLHPVSAPSIPQSAAPITVAPPSSSGATFTLPLPKASAAHDSDPRLLSVIGVGGNYQAVVSVRGANLTVSNGSTLSNGWTVASIQPTSVRLERGRSHKTLSMGE